MKRKTRKSEKRLDPGHLRSTINSVKKEIDCLMGKEGCDHRLDLLQNTTLPKLERQLGQLQHA